MIDPRQPEGTVLNMTTIGHKPRGLAVFLVLILALLSLSGLSIAHAQQLPAHVYSGNAFIDSDPASDGTTVTAWIDGQAVANATVDGSGYTLTVQQPEGQSYAGKTVTYRVGKVQTGERRDWVPGGVTEVNLFAYVNQGASGGPDRLPGRFIRECVLNALGRLPLSKHDMTAQEVSNAMELCPSLKGRMGALTPGNRGGGSLQDAIACTAKVLGRMPMGPQDMTGEERLKVFQACPAVSNNLEGLMAMDRNSRQPRMRMEEQNLRDEHQRNLVRLDERRFEMELESDRQRMEQARLRAEQADRERFARERQQQGERFQRQSEMDRQRMELERQRMEQERRIRDQQRLDREFGLASSSLADKGIQASPPTKGILTRGFFTNSTSGQMSDVDRFMDPTSLAVLGILLTLVATSLSLVKGS